MTEDSPAWMRPMRYNDDRPPARVLEEAPPDGRRGEDYDLDAIERGDVLPSKGSIQTNKTTDREPLVYRDGDEHAVLDVDDKDEPQ
jgi:hypothetical protein